MEHLYIEATAHTPEVYFNIDDAKLCIVGRSFPEDSALFYKPVLSWLEGNIQEFKEKFSIEVNLEYYNTSSSKYLVKMFRFLEQYHAETGLPVSVRWMYPAEDVDLKEAGLEYHQFVSIPFEYIPTDKK